MDGWFQFKKIGLNLNNNNQRLHRALWCGISLFLIGNTVGAFSFAEKILEIESPVLKGSITRKQWYEAPAQSGRAYHSKNRWIRKADKLTEEYKLGAAEYYYRLVLKKDPKNAGAHHGLGKIYVQRTTSSNQRVRQTIQQLENRAIQAFLTALRYEPNYVEAHINLGQLYLKKGRMEDAKESFANALALEPSNSRANESVGQVLLGEGAVNEAITFFQKAIKLKSGNSSAHYLLGKAYIQRGEYDNAYEQLNIALYQNQNSAPIHYEMGLLYEQQGNGGAAVNEFKKAITIKPEYDKASLHLSQHYEKRGDLILALEQLKNTLESIPHHEDPGYYKLTQRIAQMHLKNNQPEIAASYYQKVLRYWADDTQALKAMSQVTLLKAQRKQALASGYGGDLLSTGLTQAILDESLAYNPANIKAKMIQVKLNKGSRELSKMDPAIMSRALSHPAYMANESIARGEIWTARFDYKQAQREFESAMTSVSTPEDMINVGEMLLDMGQPDFAIQTFQRVLNTRKAQAPIQKIAQNGIRKAQQSKVASQAKVNEALLYHKGDNSSQKRQILDEALRLDHQNAIAHRMLAEFYAQYKNYPWAIRHYHVYLSLNPSPKEARKIQKRIMHLTQKRGLKVLPSTF